MPRRTPLSLVTAALGVSLSLVAVDATASVPRISDSLTADRQSAHRKPLFGVSVFARPGQSYRDALRAASRRYGGLAVARYFEPDLPNPWRIIRRDVGRRPVVTSFRADPSQVLAGRYDHQLRHWFRHAPTGRATWWSYLPEPEVKIQQGQYSARSYRRAWAHISRIEHRAHNRQLRATLVLMCYTLSPYSGRHWRDYWPGSRTIDVLGWDCYNDYASRGIYESPRKIFRKAVRFSARRHKPWGIAETGSPLVGADQGSGRAHWLRRLGRYAIRHDARFATYFDINWNVDYRLRDPRSIGAWSDVIDHQLG